MPVFEKDGKRLIVNDRVHIDCLKAKGWAEIVEQAEEPEKEPEKEQKEVSNEEQAAAAEEVKTNARKTSRRTE